MGTTHFSKSEAIRFGWKTAKGNIGFFIGVLFAAIVIMYIIPFIIAFVAGMSIPALIIQFIIGIVAFVVATLGVMNIALQFCDTNKAEFADFYNISSRYVSYLICSILYVLIVMVLFIVPMIPNVYYKE